MFPWGTWAFSRRTFMSLGRKSLSCFEEQLKPFFPWGTIMFPKEKELKLSQGTNVFEFVFD